jgi:hypothetical protein
VNQVRKLAIPRGKAIMAATGANQEWKTLNLRKRAFIIRVKMNTIIILCGSNDSGKTATMKGFFVIDKNTRSPHDYIERKLDGRIVCAFSFGSPQEKVQKFCAVEKVQDNIQRRIDECNKKASSKPYILIIPFTMSGSRIQKKKINEDCIIKPINWLKKDFHIFVIHLRKGKARNLKEQDDLMKDLAIEKIETTKKDYDKSSDLINILRQKIFPNT